MLGILGQCDYIEDDSEALAMDRSIEIYKLAHNVVWHAQTLLSLKSTLDPCSVVELYSTIALMLNMTCGFRLCPVFQDLLSHPSVLPNHYLTS